MWYIILFIILLFYFKNFLIALFITALVFVIISLFQGIFSATNRDDPHEKLNTDNYSISKTPSRPTTSTTATNSVIKSVRKTEYKIINNDSVFDDNLNYYKYRCKAKYSETGRNRTVELTAFSEKDAKLELSNRGFEEPMSVSAIAFPRPTEAQIDYCRDLGILIPKNACKEDVRALISKHLNNDSIPNPELLQYATDMKIGLSYYIGKKELYDYIFDCLELRDKIAFFAFSIYRFVTNDRYGNLYRHPKKAIFYEFADEKIEDKSFIKSMNSYDGSSLRYFGTINVNGNTYSNGGSKTKLAYKEVITFLDKKKIL